MVDWSDITIRPCWVCPPDLKMQYQDFMTTVDVYILSSTLSDMFYSRTYGVETTATKVIVVGETEWGSALRCLAHIYQVGGHGHCG